MWLYVGLYLVGICAGVAANLLLDVQLHKPALSQQITFGALTILVAVIIAQTTQGMAEGVLLFLWIATGALAGLGSRGSGAIPT
ncbi:MAG: hypothetical protein U0821_09550 [Chloroflexota bacterium]